MVTKPAVFIVELKKWLEQNGMLPAKVYPQSEWKVRGERYGNDSPCVLVIEESPLYAALNYGEPSWDIQARLDKFLAGHGYYAEMLYAWAVAFYEV